MLTSSPRLELLLMAMHSFMTNVNPPHNLSAPDGLTVDPITRLLFWTDMGLSRIQVSQLDGSNRKTLVTTEIEHPRSILADPSNG